MSSRGGLSSMQKSAGNRRGFVAIYLLTLIFLLGMPILGEAEDEWMKSSGIIAISDSSMNWIDAKAYCQQKGARLPLINGAASLSDEQMVNLFESSGGIKIEGFGTGGGSWPSGLPSDLYWTGTVNSDYSDRSWYVVAFGGKVYVDNTDQSYDSRIFCVR